MPVRLNPHVRVVTACGSAAFIVGKMITRRRSIPVSLLVNLLDVNAQGHPSSDTALVAQNCMALELACFCNSFASHERFSGRHAKTDAGVVHGMSNMTHRRSRSREA